VADGTELPIDRVGVPRRGLFVAAMYLTFVAVGIAVMAGAFPDSSDDVNGRGRWFALLPEPLQMLVGGIVATAGLALFVSSVAWYVAVRRKPQLPVVRFESTRLAVRNSLWPRAVTVDRADVSSVRLLLGAKYGVGLGLWPMVIVHARTGRNRAIQHLYDGDPEALAQDIARWASVPIQTSRRNPSETPPA
jgi:hypothetical protein